MIMFFLNVFFLKLYDCLYDVDVGVEEDEFNIILYFIFIRGSCVIFSEK